jgi:hypothetical protein
MLAVRGKKSSRWYQLQGSLLFNAEAYFFFKFNVENVIKTKPDLALLGTSYLSIEIRKGHPNLV